MRKQSLVSLLLLFSLWLSFLLPVSGQQPQTQPSPAPTPAKQSTLPAQKQSPTADEQDEIVRITTNLVQVDAVVMKDDKQVTNLKAEDFEILEDGHPQAITNFAYISNVVAGAPLTTIAAGKNKDMPPVPAVTARANEVRRTIALVVDDLGTSFESLMRIRRQLHKFVDEQLQPNDLAAIIRTGGEVGALQQFTTDRRLLHSAVEHLRWNPCSRAGLIAQKAVRVAVQTPKPAGVRPLGVSVDDAGSLPCSEYTLRGTLAALRFILQGMRDLAGRKSLIILSDNLPVEQQEPGAQSPPPGGGSAPFLDNSTTYGMQLQRIAELAIRATVVIYAVDTRGLETTGLTAADQLSFPPPPGRLVSSPPATAQMAVRAQIMPGVIQTRSAATWVNREGSEYIAKQTGGFLVRNSNDFELPRVMEDQQGYYLIGYRPIGETFDRRFHHITVRVKGHGLTVRSRAGFYGVTDADARALTQTVSDQTNLALASPFGAIDIPVRLTTLFANTPAGGSVIRSLLHFDVRDLTFSDEADNWHKTTFDLSTIIFGDNGAMVSQTSQTETLRLHGQSYDRVLRNGLVYSVDTPVKTFGAYQFRVAVRDVTSGRLGTAGQFLEVPDLRNGQLALSGIAVSGHIDSPDSENSPSAAAAASRNTSSGAQQTAAVDAGAVPAVRRFGRSPNLFFGYTVYNAQLDKTTRLPKLTGQTRVFRDGKPVFTGEPIPIDPADQSDLQRINAGGLLQLGNGLPPGEYVLQIIVTDVLAKEKHRTATQWIDFEIVK